MTDESYEVRNIHCSHSECEATVKAHYWAKVKSGWFFQTNGDSWCTEHIPDWVPAWREKKRREAELRDGWSESDLEHLKDPVHTIREALRDYVGDGNGLADEVLGRYRDQLFNLKDSQ